VIKPEPREITVSESVKLCVDVYSGGAETVVMLPASGSGAAALGDLPARIATAGYETVAVNPRGAAGSTGPVDGITYHDLAGDVAFIITVLGAGAVHVIGNAGGNRVARCLAADRPELVRTLILLAAGGMIPPDPETVEALRRLRAGDFAPEGRREVYRRVLLAPSSDPRLGDVFVPWPDTRRAFASAASTPLSDWWRGGNAPILVLQGLDDRAAPPANGRALAEEFPNRVRLVELPDAGHALHVEQPAAVTRVICDWLQEHTIPG
jgi:pimeloyl-ACP methyl ester carboxylesterase